MLRHKLTYLFFFLLTVALALMMISQNRVGVSLVKQTVQEREAKPPVVDYDAPEFNDKEEREKRKTKGRKYDKANLLVNPSPEMRTATSVSHWFYGMLPLPTGQSDVIVLGEVSSASAFLSTDKTGVYSEYKLQVDQVFKTDDATITPSQTINAERLGGRVRLPSGLIQSYKVLSQGAPRISGKYILFLKRVQGDLLILTGYELRQDKVRPT